ncbi:MAG: homoserine dehydrogenase [Planctomycetota bacterium]
MNTLNIGLVGFGTVGAGVARIVLEDGEDIAATTGLRLALGAVCDVDLARDRGVDLPDGLLTDDADAVLADPEIDVICELVGGTTFARDLIVRALAGGKHVVTANKALLAEHGRELFARASAAGRSISFEGSVCGGIPLVRAVRDGYPGSEITQVMGIVNGTCNYILTEMAQRGASYEAALAAAQEAGFAEADPSLDVNGVDSAHKLAVLARVAFCRDVDFHSIHIEGIGGVQPADVRFGAEMGYVLKLLAIGKRTDGELELRVHPVFLPRDHPLASVSGVFNAVWTRGRATGDTMHYGRGAGQMPTAAAVVSDLIDVGLGRAAINAAAFRALSGDLPPTGARDIAEIETRYYLRFTVVDQPGVLAAISGFLGEHHISIASAIQPEQSPDGDVPIVMLTHRAREHDLAAALAEIDRLDVVKAATQVIRIER